jgi:hypothetical protein
MIEKGRLKLIVVQAMKSEVIAALILKLSAGW